MTFDKAIKEARKGISYKTHYKLLKITSELYERMKEKGLNFSKIAKKLNVSRARISALFSCQHNVTLKTLIAVADALDCDLEIKLVPKEIEKQKRPKNVIFIENFEEEKQRYKLKKAETYKIEQDEGENEVQIVGYPT